MSSNATLTHEAHTADLVELAALVAAHSRMLTSGSARISDTAMASYWTASKCRIDRWVGQLGGCRRNIAKDPPSEMLPLVEEIFTGEILVRVWAAAVSAIERRHRSADAEPMSHSVFEGQQEARYRAWRLISEGSFAGSPLADSLVRLHRRCQRWSDLLIGSCGVDHDVSAFAFDAARSQDFGDDLRNQERAGNGPQAWKLTTTVLNAAFRPTLYPTSPNSDLNSRILTSVLACFGPEVFDSTGQFRSLWLARIENTTEDTVGMVENLLHAERTAEVPAHRVRWTG